MERKKFTDKYGEKTFDEAKADYGNEKYMQQLQEFSNNVNKKYKPSRKRLYDQYSKGIMQKFMVKFDPDFMNHDIDEQINEMEAVFVDSLGSWLPTLIGLITEHGPKLIKSIYETFNGKSVKQKNVKPLIMSSVQRIKQQAGTIDQGIIDIRTTPKIVDFAMFDMNAVDTNMICAVLCPEFYDSRWPQTNGGAVSLISSTVTYPITTNGSGQMQYIVVPQSFVNTTVSSYTMNASTLSMTAGTDINATFNQNGLASVLQLYRVLSLETDIIVTSAEINIAGMIQIAIYDGLGEFTNFAATAGLMPAFSQSTMIANRNYRCYKTLEKVRIVWNPAMNANLLKQPQSNTLYQSCPDAIQIAISGTASNTQVQINHRFVVEALHVNSLLDNNKQGLTAPATLTCLNAMFTNYPELYYLSLVDSKDLCNCVANAKPMLNSVMMCVSEALTKNKYSSAVKRVETAPNFNEAPYALQALPPHYLPSQDIEMSVQNSDRSYVNSDFDPDEEILMLQKQLSDMKLQREERHSAALRNINLRGIERNPGPVDNVTLDSIMLCSSSNESHVSEIIKKKLITVEKNPGPSKNPSIKGKMNKKKKKNFLKTLMKNKYVKILKEMKTDHLKHNIKLAYLIEHVLNQDLYKENWFENLVNISEKITDHLNEITDLYDSITHSDSLSQQFQFIIIYQNVTDLTNTSPINYYKQFIRINPLFLQK